MNLKLIALLGLATDGKSKTIWDSDPRENKFKRVEGTWDNKTFQLAGWMWEGRIVHANFTKSD